MGGGTGTSVVEELSVQARLDQLEACIEEGHKILSQVSPQEEMVADTPAAEGLSYCLDRCQRRQQELNQRLIVLADKIGSL